MRLNQDDFIDRPFLAQEKENCVIYSLEQKTFWGDFGAGYIHGNWDEVDEEKLVRTGPYVPPITIPGFMYPVCTEDAKKQL